MASAGTSGPAAALLFSFSAILFLFLLLLLQAPARGLPAADLLAAALDRFRDGRGLLELATRRNMVLLCHAILLLILRDAGVLGAPASRRHCRSPTADATAAVAVAETACSAAPARRHATRGAVVWRRRPRNRAAVAMHDDAAAAAARRRPVQYQPAAATWAAPLPITHAATVAAKQIVLVEPPRNDDADDYLLDRHDPAAVVQPVEHPTAIVAADGEVECDDRRIIAVADEDGDTAREDQTAGIEMEMELADDRAFEEFIESQRRQMRQESLQLVRSG